jgi:cAMP-dependent protein kinase regulator
MGACCDKPEVTKDAYAVGDDASVTDENDELDEADFQEFDYSKLGKARQSVAAEIRTEMSDADMKNLPSRPKSAAQSSRIKAAMAKSIVFSVLNEDETERVILALAEVDKMPGDVIIKEGASVDGTENALFILESGKADVFKKTAGSGPHGGKVHQYTTQGDTFGELALLYNAPRAATVVASEQCKMWALDRTSFAALVQGAMQKRRRETDKLLAELDFLKPVNEGDRSKLADVIKFESHATGSKIMSKGEEGNAMYVVKSGKLEASVDGKAVKSYAPGDYFGELALLMGSSGLRQATVTALEPCVLLSIDRASYNRLLGNADKLLADKAKTLYK